MAVERIKLTAEDFKNLVSGKQVEIQTAQNSIFIILADIGYNTMINTIFEACKQDTSYNPKKEP